MRLGVPRYLRGGRCQRDLVPIAADELRRKVDHYKTNRDGVGYSAGRFITKDPMGYPDGPNGYGFVGGDPVNGCDPTGLYEEDVHKYLTLFLARSAGFNQEDATLIARNTQALDEDERDAMYGGWNPYNMTQYHFVSPQRLRELKSLAYAGGSLNTFMLNGVGEYLHALEDTYAHQQNDDRRVFGDYYHDFSPIDIGHGGHFHKPDWTWGVRSQLAMQMAEDVFRQLTSLCSIYRSSCNALPFSAIANRVSNFVNHEPPLAVTAQFGLVATVDVDSYVDKVRELGLEMDPVDIRKRAGKSGTWSSTLFDSVNAPGAKYPPR